MLLGQRDLLRAAVFLWPCRWPPSPSSPRTRYRLACTRGLEPVRVEAGRPTEVRLRLDNVSRLPSGVLLMEDALPYALGGRPRFVLDRVEPRGVRDVTYAVRAPTPRGRYRVGPLSVRLADPFGLCELARSFAGSDELVVTPAVQPLPAVRARRRLDRRRRRHRAGRRPPPAATTRPPASTATATTCARCTGARPPASAS